MFRLSRSSLRAVAAVTLAPLASGLPRAFSDASVASKAPKMDITVYQYQICPFCNKVKAFLDFMGVSYDTVEVNPLTKAQIKTLGTGDHKKVPVVTVNATVTVESNDIIYMLLKELKDASKDASFDKRLSSLMTDDTTKWAEWSDKKLAVMLYPNITRNFDESWQAFAYCGDVEAWGPMDRLSNR